jgi:hypothetical protein
VLSRPFTRSQFSFNRSPQLALLAGCQVGRFVLPEQSEQPYLLVADQEVVNDAQPAAAPFSASFIAPSQLPNTTGAWHHSAGLRVDRQELLQRRALIIAEVLVHMTRERGGFNELHPEFNYTLNA